MGSNNLQLNSSDNTVCDRSPLNAARSDTEISLSVIFIDANITSMNSFLSECEHLIETNTWKQLNIVDTSFLLSASSLLQDTFDPVLLL